jgi:NAD(P)-dependent dehydrogenase (short-subunit alcohol dehydrogenase family)
MGQANQRKSIFVTGAASGIGAATAKHFADKGWFVGLYDIDQSGLEKVASEIGADNCIQALLDVRHRTQWTAAIESVSDATDGKMHVLFNNAGIGRHGWFEDIAPEESDAIIDINVKGVINGVYAALPLLKPTKGARIVNVASTAGFAGSPQLAVYVASKFAVRGLTESLELELEPLDVKVTSLAPWFVDTPILDMGQTTNANHKMSDNLEESGVEIYPVSLAAECAWEAANGTKTHYGVGKLANQTRFLSRYFPGFMKNRMRKSMPERDQ